MNSDENRTDLTKLWETATENGTFMTPKHDPNSDYDPTEANFRTLFTEPVSGSMTNLIGSSQYVIEAFDDYGPHGNWKKPKPFYVLTPFDQQTYQTLGVPSGSAHYPNASYNKLVIASGSEAGWHGFAECDPKIQDYITANRLRNPRFVV